MLEPQISEKNNLTDSPNTKNNTIYIVLAVICVFVGFFVYKSIDRASKMTNIGLTNKVMGASNQNINSEYKIDTEKSSIEWFAKKKVLANHNGTVKLKSGFIKIEDNDFKKGEFIIDMKSINDLDLEGKPMHEMLLKHIKSSDFFDVEKYPESKIVIKNIKVIDSDNIEIKATLLIKDKTNEIDFKAKITRTDSEIRAESDIIIDRTKWDIKYGSGNFFKNLGDNLIEDEIKFKVNLILNPK